jgi:molecular chaperone HscB
MINFFNIFNIPQSPIVNQDDLRIKYFELQKKYHPDYTTDKTINITDINKGYSVLSNKTETILHILQINGFVIPQTNTDTTFLMQCMDWQEQIQNNQNIPQIKAEIIYQIEELLKNATDQILINNFTSTATIMQKLIYLQKLL